MTTARKFSYAALLAFAVLVIASMLGAAKEKFLESKAKAAQHTSWLAETQAMSARREAREASARFRDAPDDEQLRQEADDLGEAALLAERAAREAIQISDRASLRYEVTQWPVMEVMRRCYAPLLPSPGDMPKCLRVWLFGE